MKNHPQLYKDLVKQMEQLNGYLPDTFLGFTNMHKASLADGALSTKTKELIALSIGIAVRCDGCIAFHVHDALRANASREEIMETIGVAVMMGGGPAVVYGCEAMEALEQFKNELSEAI